MDPITKLDAQKRAKQLYKDLYRLAQRDPDQEVTDIALPVLDACLSAFRSLADSDPVLSAVRDVVSPESVTDGEPPIRAASALIVVGQIIALIGSPPTAYFGTG